MISMCMLSIITIWLHCRSPRVAPSRSNTNLQALDGPRATLGFDAPPLTGLRVSRSSASLSSLRGRGRGGETPPATPMVVAAAAARLGTTNECIHE